MYCYVIIHWTDDHAHITQFTHLVSYYEYLQKLAILSSHHAITELLEVHSVQIHFCVM